MLYLRPSQLRFPTYLGNKGSYQKTVKGGPPLISCAESKFALKKWKGRLPSYLAKKGSYRKSVKSGPPLIYHAEFKYALKKWKGCLPLYLANEGSYRKSIKVDPPLFTMPSSNMHSKNGKVVFRHISPTKARIENP